VIFTSMHEISLNFVRRVVSYFQALTKKNWLEIGILLEQLQYSTLAL